MAPVLPATTTTAAAEGSRKWREGSLDAFLKPAVIRKPASPKALKHAATSHADKENATVQELEDKTTKDKTHDRPVVLFWPTLSPQKPSPAKVPPSLDEERTSVKRKLTIKDYFSNK